MTKHNLTTQDRFWAKVDKTDECWVWTASTVGFGYGQFYPDTKAAPKYAHRWSWEQKNGPIPKGLCVLHACDNPPCVNPEHLFVGTKKDNAEDMTLKNRGRNQNKDATHCKRGHEFTSENTYFWRGSRHCRVCGKLRKREK